MFASRAGEKLHHALSEFKVDVTNRIVADFGSSTGGFVDCLLQQGAQKVYAVETGYGELAWKLREDPRVVVKERTNAMHVELPEKMDLITIDVSWTKQLFILPSALKNLKKEGKIISLIKPHYEADKKLLHKGKLTDEDAYSVTKGIIKLIEDTLPLQCTGVIKSPILGKKGENSEYLSVWQMKE